MFAGGECSCCGYSPPDGLETSMKEIERLTNMLNAFKAANVELDKQVKGWFEFGQLMTRYEEAVAACEEAEKAISELLERAGNHPAVAPLVQHLEQVLAACHAVLKEVSEPLGKA